MNLPILETPRLTIRPFEMDDLDAIHRILDVELDEAVTGSEPVTSLAEREMWLRWTVLGYEQLERLHQPPLGDRAVVLRETGALIGACGLAPCLNAFGQLDELRDPATLLHSANWIEVGLYYALSPAHHGQGYATEAARALLDYAFGTLALRRVVATTSYENHASRAVMQRLGMTIARNPLPTPPWLQVVGIMERQGMGERG